MARKPIKDIDPIVRDYLDRSYFERSMDGASHRPAVGFMFMDSTFFKIAGGVVLFVVGVLLFPGLAKIFAVGFLVYSIVEAIKKS